MNKFLLKTILLCVASLTLSSCEDGVGPKPRAVNVPTPVAAEERKPALNENSDPVLS